MRKLGQAVAKKVTSGFNRANNTVSTNLGRAKSRIDKAGNDFAANTVNSVKYGNKTPTVRQRVKKAADRQAESVMNHGRKKSIESIEASTRPKPRTSRAKASGGSPASNASPTTQAIANIPGRKGVKPTFTGTEGSPVHGPAYAKGTSSTEKFRGIQDITDSATRMTPASTFFRTREARDTMLNSGQGKDYQWAKGTLSKGRIAGTAAGLYVAGDTIDRASGGGNVIRNETGKFDLMGVPII